MSISRYKLADVLSNRAKQEAAFNLVTTGYKVEEAAKILSVPKRRLIRWLHTFSSDYESNQSRPAAANR